jgi:DNA-binding response OmpR family regulator
MIEQIGYDFTIMVVEDNKDMRDFVCDLLQKRYKTVLSANNGADGLQMLSELGTQVNLIISDVMMPELDGLSMLHQIKSNPEWIGIPVIMLTALAEERDKLTALTIGVDDYLTKPFSVNELLIRVQNLLFNFHQRLQYRALNTLIAEESYSEELTADNNFDEVKYGHLWIKDVESIVRHSLKNQTIDVEELSAKLNISSRQLTRRITKVTGLTPSKFIRELQLQSALKEMEDGKVLSIKEVCYNNGFEQACTFSKLFKKRFGKKPIDYLKKYHI